MQSSKLSLILKLSRNPENDKFRILGNLCVETYKLSRIEAPKFPEISYIMLSGSPSK